MRPFDLSLVVTHAAYVAAAIAIGAWLRRTRRSIEAVADALSAPKEKRP